MRESSCWTRFYKKYLMELKKKLLILSLTAGFLILAAIYFRHSLQRRPPGIEEMWKEQLYMLAGRSCEAGEYEDAAELIQEILRIDPQNRRALSELARISALKGETGRALSILEDIVDDEAGFETQEEYLYTLYDYVHLLIEEDRVKEAGQYLELIVSRDPDEYRAHRELARISALKGETGRALSILEDIVDDEAGFETQEEYLHTLYDYVHLLLEEDRVKEAGQYLELIVSRDPDEYRAHRELARISTLKGETVRALSILENIIEDEEGFETQEEYLHTLYDYIHLLLEEEKPEETDKYIEIIESRQPDDYWVRWGLANIRAQRGEYDMALELFRNLVEEKDRFETEEEFIYCLYDYVIVLLEKDKLEEAEKYLKVITEKHPDARWARRELARIASLKGDHSRGLSLLENIIKDEEKFETEAEFLYALKEYAGIYYRKGNLEEAKKILDSVLEREPRSYWSIYQIARIKYLRGELEKAKEIFQGIPDYATEADDELFIYVNARLAQVYLDMGERKKALEYYEAASSREKDLEIIKEIQKQLNNTE